MFTAYMWIQYCDLIDAYFIVCFAPQLHMHTLYENYMLTAQIYAACIFIESCDECTAQSDRILLDNNAGDSAYPP